MSFRRRLVLGTAIAVALAVALASVAVYLLVRSQLRGQVDSELQRFSQGVFVARVSHAGAVPQGLPPALRGTAAKLTVKRRGRTVTIERNGRVRSFSLDQATDAAPVSGAVPDAAPAKLPPGLRIAFPHDPLGTREGYAQFVSAKGKVIAPPPAGARLPVNRRTLEVARGKAKPFFSEADVNGLHARIYTTGAGPGQAVQTARSLAGVDDSLRHLALILALVCAGGVGLAVGLALLVGRATLRPVARLTEAAEHVASTHDLSRRIAVDGDDELARLAKSFDTMLAALERSLAAQRGLVADASHELRTPLTSIRTNIEVLRDATRLSPAERRQLLADVVAQLEELTHLVEDVVELAREEAPAAVEEEQVRLDELVAAAVERARLHAPELRFQVFLEPCVVAGSPSRLARAISNLLDNAAKWSPAGRAIEVDLHGGELRVRDHGPGFEAADLEHVFDRFYRASAARGLPGSGLGLAIVRQVAQSHGGGVCAANAPGGGGLLAMALPAQGLGDASDPESAPVAAVLSAS